MSLITFDIVYKKKVDNASIKLLIDSELQQLKIMICGKYKIYDINNLYIYYKNNLIKNDDLTKIKDIFKSQRVKIEIKDTLQLSNKEDKNSKEINNYNNNEEIKEKKKCFCKCKSLATCVCDRCNELLCDKCSRKNKHLGHNNCMIKLNEYLKHFKTLFNKNTNELDKTIINAEEYKFLQYWEYDVTREINNIDHIYEFIKKQLEDIKQMQIDYIVSLGKNNNYEILKQQIEFVVSQFENINNNILNNNSISYEKLIENKKIFINLSQDISSAYNEVKEQLLLYTKAIKEIELFNQLYMKFSCDKFNIIKKNYSQIPILNNSKSNLFLNNNSIMTSPININFYNNYSHSNSLSNINNSGINNNLNAIISSPKISSIVSENNNNNNQINNKKYLSPIFNKNSDDILGLLDREQKDKNQDKDKDKNKNNITTPSLNNNNNSQLNQNPQETNEKMIYKLKNEKKIIIFSFKTLGFKEKNYIDKCDFNKELKSELDIIQINLFNKLYLLSGKNNNKFYYYDYNTSSMNYICDTLYTHYYGSFVFCNKYNMLYLLGGNSEGNNEICYINNNMKKVTWNSLPPLNEERQEFASIYYDDYIYVFFGYSKKKKSNLSSIERMNVNTNDKFEVVYINEQITIKDLGCAIFIDETENEDNKECILLLGGFNGENYIDTSLALNLGEMKIRDCEIIIPNINKHCQFLFQKEPGFVEIEPGIQATFDKKNNVHLLTKESYELFTAKE